MTTTFEAWCSAHGWDPKREPQKRECWNAAQAAVVQKLRRRIIHQRHELRRLNKAAQAYWAGVRTGMDHGQAVALRVKMIEAFGHPAVYAAEHAQPTPPKDKPC